MEFVCFAWISERTAYLALQNIKRLVFFFFLESVYSAVRTESLYTTEIFRLQKDKQVTESVRIKLKM
jgi:hypothetical protein